jgi:hypothetical protein
LRFDNVLFLPQKFVLKTASECAGRKKFLFLGLLKEETALAGHILHANGPANDLSWIRKYFPNWQKKSWWEAAQVPFHS